MREVSTYSFTSGFRAVLHDEAKDRDGMGWDEMGVPKVSFNVLHTL